jgi:hypothetical protein
MKKAIWAASAAAMALVSTAALATVTFDSTTGSGFVGKGDVQLALGFNNKQMQDNANSLKFTYSDSATYEVFCAKDFDANRTHEAYTEYKQFPRTRGVSGAVAYDPRVRSQVTGFRLTGWDGSVTVDGDPTVCPGGYYADYDGAAAAGVTDGSNVLLIETSDGGLKVNGAPLTITPTI